MLTFLGWLYLVGYISAILSSAFMIPVCFHYLISAPASSNQLPEEALTSEFIGKICSILRGGFFVTPSVLRWAHRWLEVAIEAGDPMAISTLATWHQDGR